MDRQIVYPGAIPLDTDPLNIQRNVLVGLSKLAAAMLGTTTLLNGLACTPTGPASLQVQVAPGEIYSLQNLDGTAYGSLAADTTHQIVKQGVMLDQATLSCPAPATAGQSINYLIQVTYQDADTNAVVLPYYNASNPATAYSGPANSGTAQNTQRKGQCIVAVKAGAAATTGSQTTPAPDAGYVGAWVVTVANGQTTITSTSISAYANAPMMPAGGLLVGGLQGSAANISAAGGTADALTGIYTPAITALVNGMTLYVRAGSANATTTPTFTPASGVITAKTIVKGNGLALVAGDISGGGHWIELQYDLTLDKWVLLNPATGVFGGMIASSLTTVTVTSTITSAMVGGTVFINAAGATTQTLPAASGVPAGRRIEFMNIGAGTGTVQRAGADNIKVNNTTVTSLALGTGDTLVLESDGVANWYAVSGTARLLYAAAFAASKATSGYQKLPSGVIVQWGVGTAGASGASVSNTWPLAWPNGPWMASATHFGTDPSVNIVIDSGNFGTTTFGMRSGNASTVSAHWVAIGS